MVKLLVALLTFVPFGAVRAADFLGPYEIPALEGREPAKVYLPLSYADRTDWPIVFLLHGYISGGDRMEAYFRLSPLVSELGFVLVVPNGKFDRDHARFWNATDGCCDFYGAGPDDVGYLTDLHRAVRARFDRTRARVFLVGHSNGGFMAHRLACERAELFAGLASLAGTTVAEPRDCQPARPVRILQIHATDDPIIHFLGGTGRMRPYPGSPETVERWRHLNSCGEASSRGTMDLVGTIPGDDTEVSRWENCADGGRVALWQIRAFSAPEHDAHSPAFGPDFARRTLRELFAE